MKFQNLLFKLGLPKIHEYNLIGQQTSKYSDVCNNKTMVNCTGNRWIFCLDFGLTFNM